MVLKLDQQSQRWTEHCDTFKNDKCIHCGRPMSVGIGNTVCRRQG